MDTLLLIDGNAMMHRAYYAIPTTFKTSEGVPTNMVYGFLTMIAKAIADFKPTHLIICFDTPKPTFRKEMFANYQSHRAKISDDFRVQIPIIKELINKAGITQIEKEGFEADDLIGTIVENYKATHKILILTGDKDIMQLVDKHVYVMSPQTGISAIKLYDENEVKQKLGCEPKDIPDLKGLMGDPSDNYPGAKGIGPKTACDLINRFKTVENLLDHVDEIENVRVQNLVKQHADDIRMSKQLATILRDVPIKISMESARFTGFPDDLKDFLLSLQMNTLFERIFFEPKKAKPSKAEIKKQAQEAVQDDLFS